MSWLVIANTNFCRIYDYQKKPDNLSLVLEIRHHKQNLKGSDLTSDKPGHYKSETGMHGAYEPRTNPIEVEIDKFAQEIANEIDKGRKNNEFDDLILGAPAHMDGLIKKYSNNHVLNLISTNLTKDYTHLPVHELLPKIKEDLKKSRELPRR